MARNRQLKLVAVKSMNVGGKAWDVVDRETGQIYARLFRTNQGNYSFRLTNYPQGKQRLFGSEGMALQAIEREVF